MIIGVSWQSYQLLCYEYRQVGVSKNNNQTRAINKSYKQEKELESLERDFEEFWQRYPKKDGKKPALAKYTVARRKFTHQVIMAGLEAHLPALCHREPQYIPHAATWLHQERFNDPAPAASQRANGFHAMLQERTGHTQAVHQSKPNRFLPGGQK